MIIDMIDLRISIQRGLLGNVFPKLRAVCANSFENLIVINFYCDGAISEDERELCESTLDQVIADFWIGEGDNEMSFETPIIRLDFPKRMPLNGHWVYYRHEDSSLYID